MNEENKINPRVFFVRVDKDGRKYASGVWDNGLKVYIKNFRETSEGLIADVDYQTDEQYENRQGKLVFRHKVCGALGLSPSKATMVVEIDGKKERLTCEPRQVNSKKTGEAMLVLDFGNGASLNPYVGDLLSPSELPDEESPKEITLDDLTDDTVPF